MDRYSKPSSKMQELASSSSPSHVENFLSTFKTNPCKKMIEKHDWRVCPFFHSELDQRRDPFLIFYKVGEVLNTVELAYHPLVYRTQLCIDPACSRGAKYCAKAHGQSQLRTGRVEQYQLDTSSKNEHEGQKSTTLRDFIDHHRKLANPSIVNAQDQAKEWRIKTTVPNVWSCSRCTYRNNASITTEACEMCMHPRSFASVTAVFEKKLEWSLEEEFFKSKLTEFPDLVKRLASEYLIKVVTNCWQNEIILRGQATGIELCASAIHQQMTCLIEKKTLTLRETFKSTRVLDEFPWETCDSLLSSVFIIRESPNALMLRGLVKQNMQVIITSIRIWAQAKGYLSMCKCTACMETFLPDEGIQCPSQHFFCRQECFPTLLQVQVPRLKHQQGVVECPICKSSISIQQIAMNGNEEMVQIIQSAQIDARVEKMQQEFETKLQAKVDELRARYQQTGSDGDRVQAETLAQQARNEILNLRCPSCHVVYSEFDGCMALECASCKHSFCGWCHRSFDSSGATHQHLRDCEYNLSNGGGYYATSEQIVQGQLIYRRNALKRFLAKFKVATRNAIVIELSRDLADLHLDPNYFFVLAE